MSSEFLAYGLPYLGLLSFTDAIMLYAAYLAITVSRGLAVAVYKARALWTALLALLVFVAFTYSGLLYVADPNISVAFNRAGPAGTDLVFLVLILVLLVWVDRTIASMIRLDYLRRGILRWKKVRPLYWAMIGIAVGIYLAGFYLLPNFGYEPSPTLLPLLIPLLVIPLAHASLALTVGGRRTRDKTFRSHVSWFGYFVAAFLGQSVFYVFVSNPFENGPFFLAEAYCLYRMARYLVPVSRLESGAPP
jgi:hypothetical protein